MLIRHFLTASILLSSTALFAIAPGYFSAPVQTSSGGDNPLITEVGDFNGDGRTDVAVIHSGDKRLTILTGKGDGTFSLANGYELDPDPRESVAADFNGDGFVDLAVANSATPMRIAVFLGNGDASFRSPVWHATGVFPLGLAAGDLNSDGHADLVLTTNCSGRVLLGNGDGSFTENPQWISGLCGKVALGDVNRDGKLDAVSTDWASLTVLLGNGEGTLQPPVPYSILGLPSDVALTDLNADGFLDIAVTDYESSTVSVLLGKTDGVFQSPVWYGAPFRPIAINVADVSGNSAPDIIVAGSRNTVDLWTGVGDGSFNQTGVIRLAARTTSLASGDFDGDGLTDILASHPDLDTVGAYLNGASLTVVALASSASVTEAGESVTFTAKVTTDEPEAGTPDGQVTFYAGSTVIGESTLDGSGEADFSTSSLPLGEVKVSALYHGTRRFSPAVATPLLQITNGDPCAPVAMLPAVTICSPSDGSVVSGAVRILAGARSNNPVTAMKVYIDNQPAFSTAARVVDFSPVLPSGPHHIVVQAWDSTGAVFNSSVRIGVPDNPAGCELNTKNPSVTICSPAPGEIVRSGVSLSAWTNSGYPVTAMKVYVDGVEHFSGSSRSISEFLNLRPGLRRIVVQAWNSTGAVFNSAVEVIVSSSPCDLPQQVPSVTVCSPRAGTELDSPIQFVAGATSKYSITKMSLFVDGQERFTTASETIWTSLELPSGIHSATVEARDVSGAVFSTPFTFTVRPKPARLILSPEHVHFGFQAVATTSPERAITLTNVGELPLKLNSISVSGDFTQQNNCGDSLAPAAICSIQVRFQPQMSGSRDGHLQIQHSASASPAFVTLGGYGEEAYLPCAGTTISHRVILCTPTEGMSVVSPVRIVALARSNSIVTATKIYLNGVEKYFEQSGSIDTRLAVTPGLHHLVVQSWDARGAVFKVFAKLDCSAASTSTTCRVFDVTPGVNLISPVAHGQFHSSPVQVVAEAKSIGAPIVHMKIYADHKEVKAVNAARIEAALPFAPGLHTIVVQAWNSRGEVHNRDLVIEVR